MPPKPKPGFKKKKVQANQAEVELTLAGRSERQVCSDKQVKNTWKKLGDLRKDYAGVLIPLAQVPHLPIMNPQDGLVILYIVSKQHDLRLSYNKANVEKNQIALFSKTAESNRVVMKYTEDQARWIIFGE